MIKNKFSIIQYNFRSDLSKTLAMLELPGSCITFNLVKITKSNKIIY